jgi:hypothetical protein
MRGGHSLCLLALLLSLVLLDLSLAVLPHARDLFLVEFVLDALIALDIVVHVKYEGESYPLVDLHSL